ncbi:MAG TPA: hypothetical protein VES65_00020 [Solirubrobacteraceae bacterium]|nr:hypothetical protein [Solirubrobacteraceae bacterium]
MFLAGATRIARRALLLAAGALAVLSSSAQARTPIQVQPGHGGPHTTFAISFRAPIDTTIDPYNESYGIDVKGPSRSACAEDLEIYTSSGRGLRKGQLLRVHARSPYRHARWCRGVYSGTVHEISVNPSSTCELEPPPPGCAEVSTLVGVYRFRVT